MQTALVVVMAVAAASLGVAALMSREPAVPETAVVNRPIQIADDGYAGSQTCKVCHPDQYDSWHRSYHRTMTQVATPETARAPFDNVTVAAVQGRPMTLSRTGATLWAAFDDPDSTDPLDRRPRINRPVVMITGSHHQQIYWYATGQQRLLGQLPGAYLIREQRWIPRRTAVLHPPGDPNFSETGHWNSTCIACHATYGKPRLDSPFGSQSIDAQTFETTVAELGIACEACHGPSGDHARSNRNPLRRYAQHLSSAPDPTAAQPARLTPALSSQVCGQCHGIWEFYDRDGERRANSAGIPFRPGDALLTTRFLAQPTTNQSAPTMKALLADDPGFIRDSFWADGMVRVTGREYNGLIESPCFKNAPTGHPERAMSCFSCHTMHQPAGDARPIDEWADDQLAAGMRGDTACLQCHDTMRSNPTAHTKHAANSSGSRCYNCHMPYTTYGLLKTIRSHTVSSPSVRESVESGRPNACNLCHLDKTLAWTGERLGEWNGNRGADAVPLRDEERSIAASLLWLLGGDAGQSAIVAQAMGQPEPQQAAGADWMAPHLAALLDDPYDAVRFIAARSLATMPGFTNFAYDFVAPQAERYQAQLRTMSTWDRARTAKRTDAHLLFTPQGTVNVDAVRRLLRERNTRRVLLRE